MSGPTVTLRIDDDLQEGLIDLSEMLNRPVDRLLNEAVKEYMARVEGELKGDLSKALEDLRSLRKIDAGFRRAQRAFVEAEVSSSVDPAEARVLGNPAHEPASRSAIGPAQKKIINLLNG